MKKDKAKLISAMTIFGTIGLVRKYIPCSSALVSFVRGFIGALFLLALRRVKKEKFDTAAIKKNVVKLLASGIALGVNWILLFEAYRYTTISVATICYYMAPVFIILTSPFFFRERITLQKGLCSAIAVCGMVFVSGVTQTGVSGLTGVFYGLGAAVLYAAVVTLNKKMVGLSASDRTILQLAISAIALLPYVLLTDDISALKMDAFSVLMLLVAGVVHTGIAYSLYFGSLRNVPAQTAALFSYIDPTVAVLISALVLKEGITAEAIVGVVMVIGAAMASEIDFKKVKIKEKCGV
ncbi:DMT family transporter [Thermocaproicibacter melissae]|uniref:DMT family transporter n=1 Tax=Thermocaproicibacter melissae TaxID=2966552 RepID=UPI0024B2492F|nr:DMT family transporter [Thermocaproicibacter melissae]WBY64043.1 DMT family transporter [Thermocaproicibacter melissae]